MKYTIIAILIIIISLLMLTPLYETFKERVANYSNSIFENATSTPIAKPTSSLPATRTSQNQAPPGFKGPTGPPHIKGPTSPPPNY